MKYSDLAMRIKKCRSCEKLNWPVEVEPLPAIEVSVPVQIMFVGENPSWADDQTEPFSATTISGRALDDHYLSPLSLTRSDVWITDLIKCRYPLQRIDIYHDKGGNKELIQRVASQCSHQWLIEEIRFAQPSIIITLSKYEVFQRFCESFSLQSIPKFINAVGKPYPIYIEGHEYFLFPMIHPDVSRPEGDGDNRKLTTRKKWAQKHANEHIPALRNLLHDIHERTHGSEQQTLRQ